MNTHAQADAAAGFKYLIEVVAPDGTVLDSEVVENMVPIQGLNHIASVVFKQATQVAEWFIAPYEGNYDPVPTVTAATAPAASTESTAYDEATRQSFVSGSVSNGALDNVASRAEFTFNADKVIYGIFMASASPKGATSGVLVSFVRFTSPKTCDDGSVLRVTAGFAIASI